MQSEDISALTAGIAGHTVSDASDTEMVHTSSAKEEHKKKMTCLDDVQYELETIAAPVRVKSTIEYLQKQVCAALAGASTVGPKGGSSDDYSSDAVLIAKYSDKKVKGKTKMIAKLEKKIDRTKRPRYYLPLIFATPEKKSILRRLKVLDIRDDRRFEVGNDNSQWFSVYGPMLLIRVDTDKDGRVSTSRNLGFSLDTFRTCGGILNARFWDINLRYGESVTNMPEEEAHGLLLAAIQKEITGDNWSGQDRTFSRRTSHQTMKH